MSALVIACSISAFLPVTPRHHRIASPRRTSLPIAFLGPEDEDAALAEKHNAFAPAALYRRTESGLSYKDLELGDGELLKSDAMVSITYTAGLVSTGEILQRSSVIFVRGGSADLFDEAIEGMKVGGTRRVIVSPSSKFSVLDDEDVEFTFEVTSVKEGRERALIRAGSAIASVSRLAFFYLVTSTLLDIFFPATAAGSASAQHVDAANAWAAQGLSAVGLL